MARPEDASADLRRPCGPSSGSASALLTRESTMRSLRCSSLHPNLNRLDRRISRRGSTARAFLHLGMDHARVVAEMHRVRAHRVDLHQRALPVTAVRVLSGPLAEIGLLDVAVDLRRV